LTPTLMRNGRSASSNPADRPGDLPVRLRNRPAHKHVFAVSFGQRLKWAVLVAAGLFGACSTSVDSKPDALLTAAVTISQDATTCRRSLADNIEYQSVARRMPLVDIYQATLRQMADTQLASPDEISALLAWAQELQRCRYKTLAAVRQHSPIAL